MRFFFTPWIVLSWLSLSSVAAAQTQSGRLPDIPIPSPTAAQPATAIVSEDRARSYSSPVRLYPGRASIIDFSQTGEIITFIQLSDPSNIVYETNAPIDSGVTTTIVLRLVQDIQFEGLTTASVPNIVVTTINEQGQPHVYLFDLYRSADQMPGQLDTNGIAISPAGEVRERRLFNTVALRPNRLRTSAGEATLDDIERGLAVAIERNYTPAADPVVPAVERAIAQARNGTPLRTAADQLGLDLAILTALGEIGIEAGTASPNSRGSGLNPPAPAMPELEIETEVNELI